MGGHFQIFVAMLLSQHLVLLSKPRNPWGQDVICVTESHGLGLSLNAPHSQIESPFVDE